MADNLRTAPASDLDQIQTGGAGVIIPPADMSKYRSTKTTSDEDTQLDEETQAYMTGGFHRDCEIIQTGSTHTSRCNHGNGNQTCAEYNTANNKTTAYYEIPNPTGQHQTGVEFVTAYGDNLNVSILDKMANLETTSQHTDSTVKEPEESVQERVMRQTQSLSRTKEQTKSKPGDETTTLAGALGGTKKPPRHALGGDGIFDSGRSQWQASTPQVPPGNQKPKAKRLLAGSGSKKHLAVSDAKMQELERLRVKPLVPGAMIKPPKLQPFSNPENTNPDQISEDKNTSEMMKTKEEQTEPAKVSPETTDDEPSGSGRDSTSPYADTKAYEEMGRKMGEITAEIRGVRSDLEGYKAHQLVEWGEANAVHQKQQRFDFEMAQVKTKVNEIEKNSATNVWETLDSIVQFCGETQSRIEIIETKCQEFTRQLDHLSHYHLRAQSQSLELNQRLSYLEKLMSNGMNRPRVPQPEAQNLRDPQMQNHHHVTSQNTLGGGYPSNMGTRSGQGPLAQGFGTMDGTAYGNLGGNSGGNSGRNPNGNPNGNSGGNPGYPGGNFGGQGNQFQNPPPQFPNFGITSGRSVQLKQDTFPKLTGFNPAKKMTITDFATWKESCHLRMQMNSEIANLPIDRLIAAILVGMGEDAGKTVRNIIKQNARTGSYDLPSLEAFFNKLQAITVGSGGNIRAEAMHEFNSCNQKSDEESTMFHLRLLATFKIAYPDDHAMNWQNANRKFIEGLYRHETRRTLINVTIPIHHPNTQEVPNSEEGYHMLQEYVRMAEANEIFIKNIKINKQAQNAYTRAPPARKDEPMQIGALKTSPTTTSAKGAPRRTSNNTRQKARKYPSKEKKKFPYTRDKWNELKEQAKKTGKCFKCLKAGHFAAECTDPIALLEELGMSDDENEEEGENGEEKLNLDDESDTDDEETGDEDDEDDNEEVIHTIDTTATVAYDTDHWNESEWNYLAENWAGRAQSPR